MNCQCCGNPSDSPVCHSCADTHARIANRNSLVFVDERPDGDGRVCMIDVAEVVAVDANSSRILLRSGGEVQLGQRQNVERVLQARLDWQHGEDLQLPPNVGVGT